MDTYLTQMKRLVNIDDDATWFHRVEDVTRIDQETADKFPPLIKGSIAFEFNLYGLTKEQHRRLVLAFVDNGVRVPGTDYKFRYTGAAFLTALELAIDTDVETLPVDWMRYVYQDKSGLFIVIGKDVPAEIHKLTDFDKYEDKGDVWVLTSTS